MGQGTRFSKKCASAIKFPKQKSECEINYFNDLDGSSSPVIDKSYKWKSKRRKIVLNELMSGQPVLLIKC